MPDQINKIKTELESDLAGGTEAEVLKKKYLGKDSQLMGILGSIPTLPVEQRKDVGREANLLRKYIEERLESLNQASTQSEDKSLSEVVDITEPASRHIVGSQHLVSRIMDEVIEVFGDFGFEYVEGPEIETDWYCFERLNMPPDHPARDMQDTFYLDAEQHVLPRTHTSAVQVRYAEKHEPPFRIVVPGRVYRNETVDARHTFMFHQFEAMIVDDVTTVTDCKNMVTQIVRRLLQNDNLEVRFRHCFFPYTEPSFEIDGTCVGCMGKGCSICSNKGWLELGGLGMVHPEVLRNVGIDPEKYQGFALGFGPERFGMLRHGIDYLSHFFENDLRFNRQFR
jgi:phenylalanyl-tRNA synthetase alpha chain